MKINKETCIGCGTCTAIAPNTFKIGDDGKAEVTNSTGDSPEVIKDAVESCPVQAIEE